MDGWIMIGIVVFVMIGQAVLWGWVLIEHQRKIPDVKILNWQELVSDAKRMADDYYKMMSPKR
ncbi:hypothetical protein [Candidatus Oscillochloris fontis]|uniref:hypothetical protein n=1 Tax=Candidatus Oscillochloris fontis TaxID=2496868 RepID=UPI00101B7689|nr:hypothetical protein [Candidatus Oscillochloris fontis]